MATEDPDDGTEALAATGVLAPDDPEPRVSVRKIGFWGAPGSGKTTFLAALNIAIIRSRHDLMIYGDNDDSTTFLTQNTERLTRQRVFPPATRALTPLRWVIRMPVTNRVKGKFGWKAARTTHMPFQIDLLDAPGRMFEATTSPATDRVLTTDLGFPDDDTMAEYDIELELTPPEEQLIRHLAGCDGIVFIFDPVRELKHGDAYHYFHGTLLKIAQQVNANGGSGDIKLKHHVAVCVTKFDNPSVYQRARDRGYNSYNEDDPYFFPYVQDDMAAEFFSELCRDTHMDNAELVAGTLGKYFYPERIKYFITSGIGFHIGADGRFDELEYQNIERTGAGSVRIRGAIHPINVIEPLLWLGQSIVTAER